MTAARVVELLGGIWTWAAKRDLVASLSITRGVDRTRALPKDRTLSADELGRLGRAIQEAREKLPQASLALTLIALTGSRREEIVRLKWAEVDLAGSCLRLDLTKTGRSTRPLGNAVVDELRARSLNKVHPSHVFPNSRNDGPADLKKAIARIFNDAGLTDARSHDLRRTFATMADELGYSEATIGEILGHARRGVTGRHYIRRPDEALIAAATRISDRIATALSGDLNATVLFGRFEVA
jgi:integrase